MRARSRTALLGLAASSLVMSIAVSVTVRGQAGQPFPGTLEEHPAIRYAEQLPGDKVAALDRTLRNQGRTLTPEGPTGYLRPLLQALDIPVESQLLVFSKTGLQREFTGPRNPRALYFGDSVVVGYIPGAPSLEIAAQDPRHGVMFYTLRQDASAGPPTLERRTECLACHVSAATLEVPGFIVRSNMVGEDGNAMPRLGSFTVNHRTPHTERWGGWFVTGNATAPPYGPLGHLGNLTVTPHPTSGPAILSNNVLIEWLNRPEEGNRHLASDSDLAALMTFDHQMHGLNAITRLGWEARVAAAESRTVQNDQALQARVKDLAEYLLFTGEASLAFEVTPRPGFAEALAARAPKDTRGRALTDFDLTKRVFKYPCSYLVYSDSFKALPPDVREAVYRQMFVILAGRPGRDGYPHLAAADRSAIAQILRDTVPDLPSDLGGTGRTMAPR